MISRGPSLSTCYSSTSSDGDVFGEEAVGAAKSRTLKPQTNVVNVENVVMPPGATVPGVLEGVINQVNFNVLVNPGEVCPENVDKLVSTATKINTQTCKNFLSSDNNSSFKHLLGSKKDVEGLSRRWCYLITALVILALITLLGTAVLSVTNWRSTRPSNVDPAYQFTVDGLAEEEKHFAATAISSGLKVVTRSMWSAGPLSYEMTNNTLPVGLVVICHTASVNCSTNRECIALMKSMQKYDQESEGWADLGFNFVIGGPGLLYYVRGFNFIGAHTKNSNNGSIGVAFIGTYIDTVPDQSLIDTFNKLIEVGLKEGKISPDYTLMGHCQLHVEQSPGLALMHNMATWPHYNYSYPVGCFAR